MKKFFSFMLFACFAITLNAQQLTLLHTFYDSNYDWFSFSRNSDYAANAQSYMYIDEFDLGQAYYADKTDEEASTFTRVIYNADFSIRSNTTYNIPKIEGYAISWVDLYTTMFDDDENSVELLVRYYNTESGHDYNIHTKLILYKSDGTLLYDFGTAYEIQSWDYLHYYNGEFRIWVEYFTDNPRHYWYKVFKVNKQSATGLKQVPANLLPYPNPTRSNINIPLDNNGGTLNIYDLNGRRIQSIPANGENINLNVSGYPSGQYIYEHNGNTNRFIVK